MAGRSGLYPGLCRANRQQRAREPPSSDKHGMAREAATPVFPRPFLEVMPSTSQDLSPVTYHPPCPLPEQTWEPIANPYSSLARLAQFHFLLLNASVTFRGYSSGGLVMWVRGTRPEDRFQGPKCSFSNGARNLLTVDLTRQEKETRIPELVTPVPPTLFFHVNSTLIQHMTVD